MASFKTIVRRLGRAFEAKDSRAFDEALEDLEEHAEESKDESSEEGIEIHNHMPGNHDTIGEMPPAGGSVSSPAFDNEPPPWAKKMQEDMKSCMDSVEGLKKWAEEEGREPEHSEDRRHDDRRHDDRRHDDRRHDDRRHDDRRDGGLENLGEHAEHSEDRRDEEDPNLEMDRRHGDRHRDRRHDDRRHDDRRDRRMDDEANKEILGELEFEAPPGTGETITAKDSAFLEEPFQEVVSKAEALAPGIRLPTFDRRDRPVKTLRAMDSLRRTALDLAYNKAETRGAIDQAMSGRTMDSKRMSVASTRVLFNAVASAVESSNNRRATDHSVQTSNGRNNSGARIQSLSDINKANREKYARS